MRSESLFAIALSLLAAMGAAGEAANTVTPSELGIRFVEGSSSKVIVQRNGREYTLDLATRSITESGAAKATLMAQNKSPSDGASIFKQNCTGCHGADGKGIARVGTPDFTNPKTLGSMTEEDVVKIIKSGKGKMPAWSGKLSDSEIQSVAAYVRSLGTGGNGGQVNAAAEGQGKPSVYEAGDDVLVTLPTGRRRDRHGIYVNFAHRFAYDPAFSGPARGGDLLGLDGFALASFGFGYGITRNLSIDVYRSPTFLGRPIQVMAAYSIWDEGEAHPVSVTARFSTQGLNDFSRQFTENFEAVVSRSITPRAAVYVVPTFSANNRVLLQPSSIRSEDIPAAPGVNSFSLGIGVSVDIRPTVALLAEVSPTLFNAEELGIHRPAYAFGIQKKIKRHAFTLGFTNSPGTTVAQRSGTLATFLGRPGADKPSGLVMAFDITRQIR